MSTTPRSVLLVHGAWHGPWCWDEVATELEARGCLVDAVELPLGGYAADVAHLRGVVEGHLDQHGTVTIAAHSYGGMVATAACSGLTGIDHLIYVAAMMPDVGETVRSIVTRRESHLAQAVVADDHGRTIDPTQVAEVFYSQSPPSAVEKLIPLLRPMPPAAVEELTVEPAWRTTPTTYIVCEADLAFNPETQREFANERADRLIAIDRDHSPFVSDPLLTAHLILSPSPTMRHDGP